MDFGNCNNCEHRITGIGVETWHTESGLIRCALPGNDRPGAFKAERKS